MYPKSTQRKKLSNLTFAVRQAVKESSMVPHPLTTPKVPEPVKLKLKF